MAVLSKLLKTAAKKGKDVVEEADITRKAKIEANRREANINRFGYDPNESKTLPDTSYRFQHQPRSDGARLDDMTGGGEYFPDDIYSSKGLSYYGDPKNKFDVESFNVIQSVKGKPNDEVTIYRAVPKDEKIKDINEGDFVTLSKDYAELHAASGYGVGGNESGKIISKKVKVKDLRSDGNDLNEFGYFPEKELGLAPPLEIGLSEEALKGTFLRNYTARDAKNMDILSENSTAGSSKADKLINKKVKENEKVAVRLNLNSRLDRDAPQSPANRLQTIHPYSKNGEPQYKTALSYKPYVTVENVVFNVNQKSRVGIAAKIRGLDVPEVTSKIPAMSVGGNYNSTRNVLEEMADDVVEIGFNPANTHLFIDLKTGQAVKSAEVATVIRDRVYAKGVVYWRKKDAPVNLDASDGTPISSEVRYKFKKGGISMKKQMEMFQEGGLEQDGGTVDPVSGNEVPVGSSQEEVRDDIDAKLSEGEFVFPADVVRYIGLEKLMQLRQEAKAGLKKMEAMGQMGNSEEATLPDDIPFSPEDITVEDDDGNEGELEMNVGGVVYQPSQVGSQFNIAPRQQDPSGTMGYSYVPPVQQTGYLPSFGMQSQQPQQYTGFQSLVPMPTQKFENVSYINKTTGETMVIPHVGGNPVFQPPEGFVPITAGEEEAPKEETKVDETIETSVPTATVTQPKDDPDRMLVGDKFLTKEQRDKLENEENMNRSYDTMVKQIMDNNPGISMENIKDKIKGGEGTIKIFGKEIKVPGFLFTEQGINDAVDRAYTGPVTDSPPALKQVGGKLVVGDSGEVEIKEDEKPKLRTSSIDEGTAGEAEARKAFLEAEANRKKAELARQIAEAEAEQRRRDEAEANREAARQQKRDAFREELKEQRSQGNISAQIGRGTAGGDMFKKGGIASKPKKKAMKRGGLASK